MVDPDSYCVHPQLRLGPQSSTFRLSPCSPVFLSLSLSSEAWVSSHRPQVLQQKYTLGWGVQGGCQDPLGWSLSVLPAANSCCTLLKGSQWSSLSVSGDLPTGEGCGTISSFTTPLPGTQAPSWFLFIFSSFLVMFHHSFLQFWFYEICQNPARILWELCHM